MNACKKTISWLIQNPPLMLIIIKKNFGLLILHFANGCNLKCKYCFVSAPSGKDKVMSLNVAFRAIENMCNTSDSFTIEFNAGEPLLYIDFIQSVVKHAKTVNANKNSIRFSIQTNGTIMNDKVIKLVKDYRIRMSVSIDGPEKVHDKNRVFPTGRGSFATVMKGIDKLRKSNISFGTISVITTPEDLKDAFHFFVKEGFKYVKFNILFPRVRDKENPYEDLKQIELAEAHCEIFEEALNLYEKKKYIFLSNIIAILRNIIYPFRPYMCMRSPCGAGRNQVAVDWKGNIYPCHRFIGMEQFILGHVENVRDYRQLTMHNRYLKDLWNRNVNSIPKCKDCPWKSFCGGGCAVATWMKYSSFFRESDACAYYSYLSECLIWKLFQHRETILKYIEQKEES